MQEKRSKKGGPLNLELTDRSAHFTAASVAFSRNFMSLQNDIDQPYFSVKSETLEVQAV